MVWTWLTRFRRSPKQAHGTLFDLEQAAIAEEREFEVFSDLAAVGKQKLDIFAAVVKTSREFEDGDELMAEAARSYREGMAALLMTPHALFSTDPEARRDAIEGPSDGSAASQPPSTSGVAGGPSPMELPNPLEPARRRAGRPPGSKNRPKTGPTSEGGES